MSWKTVRCILIVLGVLVLFVACLEMIPVVW